MTGRGTQLGMLTCWWRVEKGNKKNQKKKLRIESHQRRAMVSARTNWSKKVVADSPKKNQSIQLDQLFKGNENTTVKENISRWWRASNTKGTGGKLTVCIMERTEKSPKPRKLVIIDYSSDTEHVNSIPTVPSWQGIHQRIQIGKSSQVKESSVKWNSQCKINFTGQLPRRTIWRIKLNRLNRFPVKTQKREKLSEHAKFHSRN